MEGDAIHSHSDGRRDLVVIGASAGGVEVLTRVVKDLPADLPAAICIVLHISPGSPSMLAHILARAGSLPCRSARDGELLREGVILVAPPDHHLAIEDSQVRLSDGPRENGHRPAIDVLFRSAASALESRVVGVVLSGTRDDGAAGLAVIKANGGATIVQDPRDATYSGMPASAIANVTVDAIVPATLVARTIAAMVRGEDPPPEAHAYDPEPGPPEGERVEPACPSPDTRADPPTDDVERALSAAIRVLVDHAALLQRMAQQAQERGQLRSARRSRRRSQAASQRAETVRQALASGVGTTLRPGGGDDDNAQVRQDEGTA